MATKLSTPAKVRVFLVDDHPIVRRGFQLLLGLERDLAVCGEADSSSQALEKMIQLKPDVAIIDLGLRESNGLDLIKQAREHLPNLKILVFTMKSEQMYAERALRAGANGYITKEEGAEKAIEALRVLMQGKTYLGAQLAEAMMNRLAAGRQPGEATDLVERSRTGDPRDDWQRARDPADRGALESQCQDHRIPPRAHQDQAPAQEGLRTGELRLQLGESKIVCAAFIAYIVPPRAKQF